MPKNPNIKKVLVLGSGPIVIGQAAEFDYAGTQACRALKEEGVEVVLVNSNPATIMTDKDIADHVYIEPLNLASVEQVIAKERPDSILPTLGGQTGLNLAMQLATSRASWRSTACACWAPARSPSARRRTARASRTPWRPLASPASPATWWTSVEAAVEFAGRIGYPVIVRPAYTLGGSGGGIAYDEPELREIADQRPAPVPGAPGAGGTVHLRLEGDRVRGHAGLSKGNVITDLLYGEHRPGGRAHRRLHRGGPHRRPWPTRSTRCSAPPP